MFGSVAFLFASALAWRETCRAIWCLRSDDIDWWMAAWNGVGSVLFMVSAVASVTLRTTGELLNLTLVNSGTFGGARCFLAGAWLLLPEPATPRRSTLVPGREPPDGRDATRP